MIQPEATAHLNLTRWMRLGVTLGYRQALAVDKFDGDNDSLSGLVAGGHVQFGVF